MTETVFRILAPRLNTNDDTVDFIGWKVENWSYVKKEQAICEIQTMKALFEISAVEEGVIYQIALPNSVAKVGDCIGLIGRDQESIKRYLSEERANRETLRQVERPTIRATEKARELADRHGISLEQVSGIGVKGAIKESDVQRYLLHLNQVEDDNVQLSSNMLSRVVKEGNIPQHKKFMVQKLRNSLQNKMLTTIDTEIELASLKKYIQSYKQKDIAVSLLHIIMYALSRCLSKYPAFTKFQHNNQIFRYRDIDIAFVVKTFDGLLYAPVVRKVDRLDIGQIVRECRSITLRANRHLLKPEEMEGACFTVSYIPQNIISRFVALIDQFQSAIIAISGERNILCLRDGRAIQVPKVSLTLSYDHMLIDGWDSAIFLGHLQKELSQLCSDM